MEAGWPGLQTAGTEPGFVTNPKNSIPISPDSG
jgi:hypothetical protein